MTVHSKPKTMQIPKDRAQGRTSVFSCGFRSTPSLLAFAALLAAGLFVAPSAAFATLSSSIAFDALSALTSVKRELRAQYGSDHALGDVRRFFGSVDFDAFIGDEPTAIYDIKAHVVVMPDGARLEAHSGLRERADDPRFVRERMRGPTPPALYKLILLDKPFHGVTTLHLTPISGNVFGRTDLLAHTYMLRGRPESFGCVVFHDYPQFLRAFLRGRVKRLRVVPALGDASMWLASAEGMQRFSNMHRSIPGPEQMPT